MTFPARYSILAVDDDVLAVNLIERVFSDEPDMRMLATTSPSEGLAIAKREPIDLVIADQRMNEMSGLEFLKRFRELLPDAVRILLTAYPDLQASLQAINEGLVYRFMLKPWNVDEMRVSVRRAVEARRVALENERLSLELRRSFEELVQAERLATLGRLSAGLGHELGNAVMPLIGHVHLIEKRVAELVERLGQVRPSDAMVAKIQESLAAMRTAGKQVQSIVRGLKGYARRAPAPQPHAINQLVENAIQLLAHRFTGKVRLERRLAGSLPDVVCRGEEIVQVLVNLVGNAADEVHEAGGGVVRVATEATPQHVRVHVADTGRGLAPEVREQLFAPFVTTKPAGQGTGLGLSISRSLVDAHGGSIAVESTPGHGTVFTVALPLEPVRREG